MLVQRSRRDLELERTAETLRARLGDIRQIAMNKMERLRHFVREIEELTTLWQELARFSVPATRARGAATCAPRKAREPGARGTECVI